jgi:hypothetical protein
MSARLDGEFQDDDQVLRDELHGTSTFHFPEYGKCVLQDEVLRVPAFVVVSEWASCPPIIQVRPGGLEPPGNLWAMPRPPGSHRLGTLRCPGVGRASCPPIIQVRPGGLEPPTLGLEIDGKYRTVFENLRNTGDYHSRRPAIAGGDRVGTGLWLTERLTDGGSEAAGWWWRQ